MSKYTPEKLLLPLRLFIDARNRAIDQGFTDNGGAIHSVERILDIFSMRVRYPHLRHINDLKNDPVAEISKKAYTAKARGEKIMIEHVLPQRAYARLVIELLTNGASNDDLISFVIKKYRLVLLSQEETLLINRLNRSLLTEDRIADAGIELR
jgi:hypothetical protein